MYIDRIKVLNLPRRVDKRIGNYSMLFALQVPPGNIEYFDARNLWIAEDRITNLQPFRRFSFNTRDM